MSSIADDFSVGIMPAQHYDDNWDFDTLNLFRRIRIIGKDPVTKQWIKADGTNGTSETNGFEQGLAVFAPSHDQDPDDNTRNVALWGSAWAGFTGHPSPSAQIPTYPSPADPDITSAFEVFPSHSQSSDGGWRDDTGLNSQPAVSFDGRDLPGGMPGVIVPLTGATSQQLAFVPAGNALICDWFGGPKGSKYSTRIWDVTASGDRDVKIHAPIHSFWRIYRRPVSGTVSFGSATSLVPATKSKGTQSGPKPRPGEQGGKPVAIFAPGQAQDHEEAIAWVLSPGVDGNAGRGVVSDLGAPGTVQAPAPPMTATGGGNPKGTSASGPTGGNAQAANAVAAQQNPIAAGLYVPPLTLATTLTGLQDQLAKNGAQIAYAVGMGSAGASAVGQLVDQKNQIIAAMAQIWKAGTGNANPTTNSGAARAVLASLCKAAYGIVDVGDAGNDPHLLATTPDGESINQSHLNILAAWKGDGFDAPPASDGAWQKVTGGGPLLAQTYFRTDMSRKHPSANGPLPGLRSWQTPVPMDHPPYITDIITGTDTNTNTDQNKTNTGTAILINDERYITDAGILGTNTAPAGPSGTPPVTAPLVVGTGVDVNVTAGGSDGQPLTLGPQSGRVAEIGPAGAPPSRRGLVAAQNQLQRSFMRMPNELAVPALLARPQQLTTMGVPDLRGLTDTFLGNVPGGQAAYEAPPVAGVLAAFADQSGGINGFRLNEPPSASRYLGGVSGQGGFALHPPSVDIHDIIAGRILPPLPTTHLMMATTAAAFSHADPIRTGLPANGFVHQRGAQAANGAWPFTIKGALSDGSVANTSIWAYGTDASGTNQTGTDTVHTPSRGTGTGQGGAFKVAIGVPGSTGTTVHGATTRFTVAHTGVKFQNSDLSTMFQIDNTSGPAAFAFFGGAPAAQQPSFGIANLIDNTTGVASTTYAAVPAAYAQADQQTRWASVAKQLNQLHAALVTYGLVTA